MTNATLTAATPQAPDTLTYEPTCDCPLCSDARAALLALELGMLPAATGQTVSPADPSPPKGETIAIDPAAVAAGIRSASHYSFSWGWRLTAESLDAFVLDDRPADRDEAGLGEWEPWGPDPDDEEWAIETRPDWAAVGCGEWELSPEDEYLELCEPAWDRFNRLADELASEREMEYRLGW
jgi:hypothetical protein